MTIVQVVTVLLAAVVMTTSLAHALELPGKMRLSRDEYRTVQKIYYPGFTIAGVAELPSIVLAAVAAVTPFPTLEFWLRAAAAAALAIAHAVFWPRVQPANKTWMEDEQTGRAGSAFFATQPAAAATGDWTQLRHRWESGHLIRAVLSALSVILLVTALG